MRLFFAAIFLVLPAPAAAEWWEAETANFIIKSEDSEAATRDFAIRLERFDAALRSLQGLPVGEEQPSRSTKLTVYRFGSDIDIARMAGASDSGIAGFYIPSAGDSVAFAPAKERRERSRSVTSPDARYSQETALGAETVLKHEYVHYFMMQHFPAAYPRWYVEGYAEMLATLRLNDDGSFFVGDPPVYRSYEVLNLSQFRLSEMLDARHDLSGIDAYMHYATGWLLTHYLNFNPTRLAQLNAYLTAIGQGEDSLAAGQRIFGDLRALDAELRSYRRGPFPGFEVKPVANYTTPEVRMRALDDAEEVVIDAEMRLRRGTTKEEAKRLLVSTHRDATPYPDDFAAQSVVARAAMLADDHAAAAALGEKLVEIDPDAAFGWLVRSMAAVGQIEGDPAQASIARSHAAKARSLDRYDPRSAISYYTSYLEAGEAPPEQAVIALESVFDTAGSDPEYRIYLARQLLSEGRTANARTVLLPIAFRGHNQDPAKAEKEEDPSLDKVMRLVDADDAPAAVAMIDALIEFWEKESES